MYPPGSKVRYTRDGMPYIGRVIEDDPANTRAKVRVEIAPGLMQVDALTTRWVDYERITERIQ